MVITNYILSALYRKKESDARCSSGDVKNRGPKDLTCPICGITKLMCRSDAKTCGAAACRKAFQRKAKKEKDSQK